MKRHGPHVRIIGNLIDASDTIFHPQENLCSGGSYRNRYDIIRLVHTRREVIPMAKMTISMPDTMGEYIALRVEAGQYGNVSEYFRDLVRREQQRQSAAEELRRLLDEAEASGVSKRKIPEIMRKVEADLRADGRL